MQDIVMVGESTDVYGEKATQPQNSSCPGVCMPLHRCITLDRRSALCHARAPSQGQLVVLLRLRV